MKPRTEAPQFRDRIGEERPSAPSGGPSATKGPSGTKLVLLGALTPVVLAGAVIGGMLALNSPREETAAAKDEAALDCRSPRHSWRWACQQAKSAEEGYGVTAATPVEGPATTGSVERQLTARSTSAKGADGEPIRAADAKLAAATQGAESPKTEAASPAASPPKTAWVEPAPEKPVRRAEPTPVPAPKAQEEEARKIAAASPGPVKPQAKIETAAAPPKAQAESAPTRVTPVAEPEPAVARAAARVTEPPSPPAAERPERRKAAAKVDEDESAPRLSRKRLKAREPASARKATASRAIAKRARVARSQAREPAPEVANGYRVMSMRSYTLPDGRRVIVHTAPRQDIVRELLAEHQATFGRRQFASPY
jgi:hypothetical protein